MLSDRVTMELHPQEVALIHELRRLANGRLERLDVQNGLPMSAELAVGRVRFDKPKESERSG